MNLYSTDEAAKKTSRHYQHLRLLARVVALGLGLIGVIASPENAVLLFTLAFIIEVVALYLKASGRKYFDIYRTCRRASMVEDAFGVCTNHHVFVAMTLGWEGPTNHQDTALNTRTYYTSPHGPGQRRLRDNLRESVFFSTFLFQKARNSLALKTFVAAMVALTVFALLPWMAVRGFIATGHVLILNQFVLLTMTFLVAVDLVEDCVGFHLGFSRCAVLLAALNKPESSEGEALWVMFADYAVWTNGTPPVPDRLYAKYASLVAEH